MASILDGLKQGNNAFLLTGTSYNKRVREGQSRLGYSIELLDKGYNLDSDVDMLIEFYGGIKKVPHASEHVGFPDQEEE